MPSSFPFDELRHGVDERHRVAAGHVAEILLRWGDPVVAGAPAFAPYHQSAEAQEMQFGYNNDYVGFLPFDKSQPNHGLLFVNHEYTNEELMFPMVQIQDGDGIVITGVHDTEGGQFSSGWVAIESGTELEPHCDHAHWRYKTSPRVLNTVLDDQQGNPAHVYNYDDTFFLANDKLNGVTIIRPSQ